MKKLIIPILFLLCIAPVAAQTATSGDQQEITVFRKQNPKCSEQKPAEGQIITTERMQNPAKTQHDTEAPQQQPVITDQRQKNPAGPKE